MTNIHRLVILFSVMLITASCEKKVGYRVDHFQEINLSGMPEDVKIPTKAWDMVEFKDTATHESNLIFSEVSVFLVQKNEGIVQGEALKINLPKGGGTIDLSKYISSERGSFYLGFEFPKFEGSTAQRVLFVSNARRRKVGDEVFGAGCNQYMDITKKFIHEMKVEGIKLNTTQQRYISVIGGTFLLSAQSDRDVFIAQVTFKGSQFKPLFCEEK